MAIIAPAKFMLPQLSSPSLPHYGLAPPLDGISFSFGNQLLATVGADIGKKTGFVGRGGVYKVFSGPAAHYRGGELYFSDPMQSQKNMSHGETWVDGIRNMPRDISYIVIQSPPKDHADNLEEALELGVPIAMEKPMAGNLKDLARIKTLIEQATVPLYFIDWTVMHAAPLYHATNVPTPFVETLKILDPENNFKNFKLEDVVKIDARFVESWKNFCSNTNHRGGWMHDPDLGGGMHRDMATHVEKVVAVAGFQHISLKDMFLGEQTNTPGIYKRIGKPENGAKAVGELYSRMHSTMRFGDSARNVDVTFECGKNGHKDDAVITLTDKFGNTVKWTMAPNRAELFLNGENESCAEISSGADCYGLMLADMPHFFAQASRGEDSLALYAHEHLRTGEVAEMALKEARLVKIPQGELVRQLALEEQLTPQ